MSATTIMCGASPVGRSYQHRRSGRTDRVVPARSRNLAGDGRHPYEAPFIQRYFSWMPVGDLQIDAAVQTGSAIHG